MNLLAADIGQTFLGNTGGLLLRQPSLLGALFSFFLSNATMIAGVLLLFLFVFSGISIIGAGGDPQKLAQAMKNITYGVAGFLVVFATYFILLIIQRSTGVPIVQ